MSERVHDPERATSLRASGLALGVVVLVGNVACGCTGEIGPTAVGHAERSSTAGGDLSQGGIASNEPLACVTPAVGPSPMRRLTHAEYDNAVAELLGDQTRPASQFPIDTQKGLFDNSADTQTVSVLLADQYLDSAVRLAQSVTDVRSLMMCDPADASGSTCVRNFIEHFGRRAFRRPLAADDLVRLTSLFDSTRAASDEATGVRAVIAAVLASPHFLFRPEFGDTMSRIPGSHVATQFEVGARLASLLWGSIPDETLLDEAAAGRLTTRDQVAAQAKRMLADPRARPAIAHFYDQWFGLPMLDLVSKDTSVYPKFDDQLRASMREETQRFVSEVIWNDDARLASLFSSSTSFIDGPLAQLYGRSAPSDSLTFTRTALNPAERRGILTQASVLTSFARPDESSPVKRGKWVRVRILCQDLPDPPNAVPELSPPKQGISNRERFAEHTGNPACSSCHQLIDGLGTGLERYDGIGRVRTMDQGVAVDSSGRITETRDIDGAYDGGPALAARLAKSAQVRDCAPTQWLRYSLARREQAEDACSLKALRDDFAASGGDLRALMVTLTQTDAFLTYRRAE